jgi:hypothetical protein
MKSYHHKIIHRKFYFSIASSACMLFLSFIVNAQTFTSTNKRVSIIELYTSEGCSSCPPADKWLSQFKDDNRLWSQLIPIAFHVDYWDYIGWKDKFANKRYSQRQQQYARNNNISTVYTPAVLLNGQENRFWFKRQPLIIDKDIHAGRLSIDVNQNKISAHYSPVNSFLDKTIILNIAILGFNLNSKILSGENKGQTLKHDFVILGYRKINMLLSENSYHVDSIQLPISTVKTQQIALATWVNSDNNLIPLQATGGWLTP